MQYPLVLQALSHKKASVRRRAAGILAKTSTSDVIINEIENLSKDSRLYLLKTIRTLNRMEVADQLITTVYSKWGAHEAAILLPACSKEMVRRYLEKLQYEVKNWKLLTYRHMEGVSEYFKTSLQKATLKEQYDIWWQFSEAIDVLCIKNPDFVLDCAINIGPQNMIHPLVINNIGILVSRCPDKVFDLFIQNNLRQELRGNGIPKALLNHIRHLSKEQWIKLGKLVAGNPHHVAQILHHIAPSDREEVFEAIYEKETRRNMIFPEDLLYELPHKVRDSEAARMLALRQISENKAKTCEIMAYRHIDHSREFLQKAAYSSQAEDRARALKCLIRSTALSRCGMNETLNFLTRIKNDQDPVKNEVFEELCKSYAAIFTEDNLNALNLLIDSVCEARDTSHSTRYAVQKLAFAMMVHNASNPEGKLFNFSLKITLKLLKQTGTLAFPSLEENIPHGLEKHIFNEIYPLISDASRREKYSIVINLAKAMGKRGHDIEKLQDLLKEAIFAKPDYVAHQAVRYWLEPRKTRDQRIKELLSFDKSYITVPEVFWHLHLRRQEWLEPYISGKIIKGKFLTGNTIYFLPADGGFHRWLPRQQKTFMKVLKKIVQDNRRDDWQRARTLRVIAKMPDVSMDEVTSFIDSSDVPIAEAALYAVSLSEEPEKAIPILMNYLDGDRARVAMYAIPRCARMVRPEFLSQHLNTLLSRDNIKITVRKEAIRLAGLYKTHDSMMLLKRELKNPDPHNDVLIAIGHAARQLLDIEDVWDMLYQLTSSSKMDVQRSILDTQPDQISAAHRPRYFDLILKVADSDDPDVRREAFYCMRQWMNKNEEAVATASMKAIMDFKCTSVWETAMDTLIEASYSGKVDEILLNGIKNLADTPIAEEYNTQSERDLPHRQRLMKLVNKLISVPYVIRLNLKSLYRNIGICLLKDETLIGAAMKIYIALSYKEYIL